MEDQVYGRRYRVTERIGSGGMADVYKAVDEVLGRTVAVKVLHPRYAADPTFVARFRQEAQAAANLSNPHIVNIYDWGQEDSTYYIVMEFVRGTDLKQLIDEKGPVDPVKAAEYAAQVCSALAVAHGYDIVHRDIKPHNIVLMPEGTIKVMDFGIARAGNTTMTQTGSVLGTAQYISPEQAQGRPIGPASDLYSLGVVLYELTTGKLPFEADTPVAVALKQVNEQPVPPRNINPAIPPALEAVILTAMQKDPAARYGSADEMRDDLRRIVAGQPVAATVPPHHAEQTSVMPAVGGGAPRGAAATTRRAETERTRFPWGWVLTLIALVLVGGLVAWAGGFIPGSNTVSVPDVTNMTIAEATQTLAKDGLVLGTVTPVSSQTVASGVIISQSLPPNVKVDKGTKVNVDVSSGKPMANVPDLSGKTQTDAVNAIQTAGFKVGPIDEKFSKMTVGTVIGQSPAANTRVEAGTMVSFTVSKGIQQVAVPDVAGKSQSKARSALEAAGLSVTIVKVFSTDTSSGIVIDTDPAAGAQVAKGATVTVRVSKGPEMVTVPNVVNMAQADATTKLQGLGFIVNVQGGQTPPTPTTPDGTVSDQDPAGGSSKPKGSAVTIFVVSNPSVPGP